MEDPPPVEEDEDEVVAVPEVEVPLVPVATVEVPLVPEVEVPLVAVATVEVPLVLLVPEVTEELAVVPFVM